MDRGRPVPLAGDQNSVDLSRLPGVPDGEAPRKRGHQANFANSNSAPEWGMDSPHSLDAPAGSSGMQTRVFDLSNVALNLRSWTKCW